MKVLIVSPYVPWPLYGGGAVRIFNILKGLSERGHEIVLLAGNDSPSDGSTKEILLEYCREVHYYKVNRENLFLTFIKFIFSEDPYPLLKYAKGPLRQAAKKILVDHKFDLIWINPLVPIEVFKKICGEAMVIFDQHECEEWVYEEYFKDGSFEEKVFSFLNLRKVKKFKQKIFKQANAVLCVSDIESDFLKRQPGAIKNIFTVTNGIDKKFLEKKAPLEERNKKIIFCANMGIRRNIEAARWFANKIFPAIREEIPETEFYIVGSNPSKEILELKNRKGIVVTGPVSNIQKYYLSGRIFVAPFHFGAGTKLKVLEAMASGLPVVSTSIGCRGIDVKNGKHLLIADTEKDFSSSVIMLLKDLSQSKKIAEFALKHISAKYAWENIVAGIEDNLNKIKK